MARIPPEKLQHSAEEAAQELAQLYIGQWASWVIYLLRALDTEAQALGYDSTSVVLRPVERNLHERTRSGRW